MPDPRSATRIRLTLLVLAIAGLGTVAHTASSPLVSKGAALLCFFLLIAAYFFPGKTPSGTVDDDSEDYDADGSQSWAARIAWAAWMSIAAMACFAIAQLAEALNPGLKLSFRALGVVSLIVAAYKLFFGRRGRNTDIDI